MRLPGASLTLPGDSNMLGMDNLYILVRYSIIPVDLVRYSIIGRLQNLVTSLLGGAERAATYQTVAFFLSYRLL